LRVGTLTRRDRGSRSTTESGQALLELALVTPILVLLVMAIFQFAYVIQSQMGLTNAVREATRRAAATTTAGPNWAALQQWTQAELCGDLVAPCEGGLLAANVPGWNGNRLTGDLPAVEFCWYSAAGSNQFQIEASVQYEHPLFFGLMAFATDGIDGNPNGSWDLSAAAQMRLENIEESDPTFTALPNECANGTP
jgi:hypothetical protein